MPQTMVYLQTGMDQEPMLATCEPVQVLDVLAAMVRREDGGNGTLKMYVNDGTAKDEPEAVLYYLGLEGESEALAAYDGQSTWTNPTGTEVFLMIRPLPPQGEIVGLWGEEAQDV